MSMYAIRHRYSVPAKRGMCVEYMANDAELVRGVITGSAGFLLRVKFDGIDRSFLFHPTHRLHYLLADGSRHKTEDVTHETE